MGDKFWQCITSEDEILSPDAWKNYFDSLSLNMKNSVPVLWSCYHRRRYVDPWTGARISIDKNIRGLAFNWRCLGGVSTQQSVELDAVVLEIKSIDNSIPPFLRSIVYSHSGYSKYEKLITAFLRTI